MAGCAGSSPCSVRGKREPALPGLLLLRPTCGDGPPRMGTARVGRRLRFSWPTSGGLGGSSGSQTVRPARHHTGLARALDRPPPAEVHG
jgi:hypothetical protein